jgi:hypothetical protein
MMFMHMAVEGGPGDRMSGRDDGPTEALHVPTHREGLDGLFVKEFLVPWFEGPVPLTGLAETLDQAVIRVLVVVGQGQGLTSLSFGRMPPIYSWVFEITIQ